MFRYVRKIVSAALVAVVLAALVEGCGGKSGGGGGGGGGGSPPPPPPSSSAFRLNVGVRSFGNSGTGTVVSVKVDGTTITTGKVVGDKSSSYSFTDSGALSFNAGSHSVQIVMTSGPSIGITGAYVAVELEKSINGGAFVFAEDYTTRALYAPDTQSVTFVQGSDTDTHTITLP